MNDANQQALDSSIIESMPPFPSVDRLIVGERRRQRVRRSAAVVGVAAAVTGLVLGIQALGLATADRPSVESGQSSNTGTSVPTARTVEDTQPRLSEALRNGLSTVVPGATFTVPSVPAIQTYQGYTGFMTALSVTTSRGTGGVTMLALWPATDAPLPTAGRLDRTFGCGGLWADQTSPPNATELRCEEVSDAAGLRLVLAQHRVGAGLEYIAIVHYSDGALVRVTAGHDPESRMGWPVLTLDELDRLVTDPSMRP